MNWVTHTPWSFKWSQNDLDLLCVVMSLFDVWPLVGGAGIAEVKSS